MATQTEPYKRPRRRLTDKEQATRLRSVVKRLRAEIRALKGRPLPGAAVREVAQPEQESAPPSTRPILPPPDAGGNYPAVETLRAILADNIIHRREVAGWSQKELAERAKVRPETVSRLETGKHAPTVTTVDKLDRALQEAGV